MEHREKDQQVEQLVALIREIRIAMLTTGAATGAGLRSRPMYTHEAPFDGTLWFMTSRQSDVVREIEAAADVLLTYAHPRHQSYAAINGEARVLDDRAKVQELWRPALKAWFPEGPGDADIRLIRVTVERAEYWEAASAPARMLQFVWALATRDRMDGGTHETLRMPPSP